MPGHLATDTDKRTQRNIKKLHKRRRRISKLRTEAAQKGQLVYDLMASLKSKRTDYLAGVQLRKFHEAIKHLEVRLAVVCVPTVFAAVQRRRHVLCSES